MRKEIENKLTHITDSIDEIYSNLPEEFDDFITMGLAKDGIYKKIEHTIQNIIDICSIINSHLRLGIPETEDNIFDNLSSKKIFDENIVKVIIEMKRFRNVLVHRYGEIDDRQAFETIREGKDDLEKVVKSFEKFLKSHK